MNEKLVKFLMNERPNSDRWSIMAKALPKEIDKIVAEIVGIVNKCDPLHLLEKIYWQIIMECLSSNPSEAGSYVMTKPQLLIHMLLYVQNIIVSSKTQTSTPAFIKEEEFKRLQELLQEKVYLYNVCREIQDQNNATLEQKQVSFLKRQLYNLNIGGNQFQYLVPGVLTKLLKPHESILQELFKITAEKFVASIVDIQTSLIIEGYKEKSQTEAKFRQDLIGGYERFDLQKITNLPLELLEKLSLSPGEDECFLCPSHGSSGWWSIKIYPTRLKPFIKIDGKYYCFHVWNFTNNIYRALEKTVEKAWGERQSEVWEKKQSSAVEEYVFELFKEILPKAEIHRNVYYSPEPGQRCETDGIIFFDDYMIIVEIKGGRYSQKSPKPNENIWQRDKKLSGKAYEQGIRFFDYINKYKDGAQLLDAKSTVIKEIKLSDYKLITICCVTLDQIAGTTGDLLSLKALGKDIDLAKSHILLLSLDHLVVYSKLFQIEFWQFLEKKGVSDSASFKESLTFCDFLNQRGKFLKSNNSPVIHERYHIGAYLNNNNYDEASIKVIIKVIDEYFNNLMMDEQYKNKGQ